MHVVLRACGRQHQVELPPFEPGEDLVGTPASNERIKLTLGLCSPEDGSLPPGLGVEPSCSSRAHRGLDAKSLAHARLFGRVANVFCFAYYVSTRSASRRIVSTGLPSSSLVEIIPSPRRTSGSRNPKFFSARATVSKDPGAGASDLQRCKWIRHSTWSRPKICSA